MSVGQNASDLLSRKSSGDGDCLLAVSLPSVKHSEEISIKKKGQKRDRSPGFYIYFKKKITLDSNILNRFRIRSWKWTTKIATIKWSTNKFSFFKCLFKSDTNISTCFHAKQYRAQFQYFNAKKRKATTWDLEQNWAADFFQSIETSYYIFMFFLILNQKIEIFLRNCLFCKLEYMI